jgi:YidC/Oxa1 family membrane protein insertase
MDKKTFAQFLVVSAIILLVWWTASYVFYRPRARPEPAPAPPAERPVVKEAPAEPPEPAPLPAERRDEVAALAVSPAPEREPEPELVEAVLANELIRTTWTNHGAALKKLELLDERYRAPYKVAGERPVLTLLRDFQEGTFSDTLEAVTFSARNGEGPAREITVSAAEGRYRLVEQTPDRLVFERTFADRQGHALSVRKQVVLEAGGYDYAVELEFENVSGEPYEFACWLRGAAGIERETLESRYLGVRIGKFEGPGDYDVDKVSMKDVANKGSRTDNSTNIAWVAAVNHYFVAVLHPDERDWVSTALARSITDNDLLNARGRWKPGTVRREADRQRLARSNAAVVITTEPVRLEPGQQVGRSYRMVAAPKEDDVLRSYDAGLTGLVEYGLWPSLSRLTVSVLNGVYAIVHNYGIAILVVTAIVRTLLHPLTLKSQLGMIKMQKLQPQVMELQRKHADDRQKMSQEQWKLFQKYGVSPLSGCWPMLLQMPVLIALFGALRAAIELRHAGFLWIDDLSRPDTLFHLPIHLPFLGNEFNLLPIIMGVVMVLNQRFMSTKPTTDQQKQQQAIMKFFPIFMAVLFYHMPSGLCLYFTTSMGIGVLERWIIERRYRDLELKPAGEEERRKKGPGRRATRPAKKGWLDKLQEFQDRLHRDQRTVRRRDKQSKSKQ